MTNASAVRRAALLLAAAAAGCAGGGTEEPPRLQDPPSIPATVRSASGRCTFDVRDQPVERALVHVRLGAGEGIPITVAPEFAGVRITLKIEDVPWRNALRAIAGQARCGVVEADGGFTLARTPESGLEDLVRLVEACRVVAGEYRTARPAGGGGDFLRIAALRRQYRQDWAALDAAVAALPEVRDPALRARFEAEVREPRESLRTANPDILEGR